MHFPRQFDVIVIGAGMAAADDDDIVLLCKIHGESGARDEKLQIIQIPRLARFLRSIDCTHAAHNRFGDCDRAQGSILRKA